MPRWPKSELTGVRRWRPTAYGLPRPRKKRLMVREMRSELRQTFRMAMERASGMKGRLSALAELERWAQEHLRDRGKIDSDPGLPEEVRRMAAAGWSANAIARRVGRSADAIKAYARRNGIRIALDARGIRPKIEDRSRYMGLRDKS